jgi:hypothetical protein
VDEASTHLNLGEPPAKYDREHVYVIDDTLDNLNTAHALTSIQVHSIYQNRASGHGTRAPLVVPACISLQALVGAGSGKCQGSPAPTDKGPARVRVGPAPVSRRPCGPCRRPGFTQWQCQWLRVTGAAVQQCPQ